MLNAQIYKKLNRHAEARSDLVTGLPAPGTQSIETFRDKSECLHLVGSMAACKAILSDDESFSPAPIAEAVRIIGEHFGIDVGAAHEFLRENPMQLSGQLHASRRKQYLSHYAATLKKMSASFRKIADDRLEALTECPPRSLVQDIVAPFVDDVLRQIAGTNGTTSEIYISVSRNNNILLEHVHHPRKLEQKSRQISAFNPADKPQDNVLLSYILQGRDPIIGGITAFLRGLCSMRTLERATTLSNISAAGMFRITSPVNYIGRVARRAISIEGVDITPGDQVLLLLPNANGDPRAMTDSRGVAFGAGNHTCAGQALALSITDAFLSALRTRHDNIDWSMLQPDTPVAAVFRQYKAQS